MLFYSLGLAQGRRDRVITGPGKPCVSLDWPLHSCLTRFAPDVCSVLSQVAA